MTVRALRWLSPPAPAPPLHDPDEVRRLYRYWRFRILYASLIGYAIYYVVRKNLPLAMPAIERDLGLTKSDLGAFLTAHGLCYGVSKFVNGFLGDRANPRYFMAMGLAGSAVANVWFGCGTGLWTLGLCWLANGWFQGMGFPPCARSLTHWFAPAERGTKFAIWNTSHSIGAAAVFILCSFLVTVNWRLCLHVPALMALAGVVFLLDRLRDSPASLGLPAIAAEKAAGAAESVAWAPGEFRAFVLRHVFLNPVIWYVSLANFFVYTVRYSVLDWGPSFLTETKGIRLVHAGWIVAAYEVSGILGMLASGSLTDRLFRGRAEAVSLISMLLCGMCVILFWRLPVRSAPLSALLLCAVGFFIYGPQCLVGVIAANAATRRAAATAIGLTGLFGYLSSVLSGWGLGSTVEHWGWGPGLAVLGGACLAAAVLFGLAGRAAPSLPAAHTRVAAAGEPPMSVRR